MCCFTQFNGLKELEPSQSDKAGLTDAAWSCSRPTVFATASASGKVYVFDVRQSPADPVDTLLPTGTLEVDQAGRRVKLPKANRLAFNPKVRDLLSVAYSDGSVVIYSLPASLSDYQAGDQEVLLKVFESKDNVE